MSAHFESNEVTRTLRGMRDVSFPAVAIIGMITLTFIFFGYVICGGFASFIAIPKCLWVMTQLIDTFVIATLLSMTLVIFEGVISAIREELKSRFSRKEKAHTFFDECTREEAPARKMANVIPFR